MVTKLASLFKHGLSFTLVVVWHKRMNRSLYLLFIFSLLFTGFIINPQMSSAFSVPILTQPSISNNLLNPTSTCCRVYLPFVKTSDVETDNLGLISAEIHVLNRARLCNHSGRTVFYSVRVNNSGKVQFLSLPNNSCSEDNDDVDGVWSYCNEGYVGCPSNSDQYAHRRVFKIPGNAIPLPPVEYELTRGTNQIVFLTRGNSPLNPGKPDTYGWVPPVPDPVDWDYPNTNFDYVVDDTQVTINCVWPCSVNKDPFPPFPPTLTPTPGLTSTPVPVPTNTSIPATPPLSGGITVISAWPQGDNLSANQEFHPNVVVKTTGFSLNCSQDFLQNRDGKLYGTGPNQGCQALSNDQYRFYFNTPMKAPNGTGTFQSLWQIWHSPNYVGPVINLWFSIASSPSGPEGVYLCRNTDFSNNCMRFDVDNPNLGASGFGNDEAESIQINGDWSAVLYENNDYDGRREVFNGSDHDLIDNTIHRNDASSIRVRRRNPPIVTLYEHNSYGGQAFDSDRAISDLNHWNYNDMASSVRVASGYCVMLYDDGNFGGNSMEVCGDRTEVGGLDNRISSFAICNGHCPVPPTPTPIPTPTNTPFPAAAGDLLNSFEAGTDGLHINTAADNSATTITSATDHATDGTKVAQLTFNHNSSVHNRAIYQYDFSPNRDLSAYNMLQFDLWANQPAAIALVLGTGPSYTWFESSSQQQLVAGNNTVQFNLKNASWNGGGSNNVAVADLNDVRYLAFLIYPAGDGQDSVYLDNLRLYPIQTSPTPAFTSTPTATDLPMSTPSPTFSPTQMPTNTPVSTLTNTPLATNTPTSMPTSTPVPATPTPVTCTGRITGLALFDINAGQPVPSYNPIPNGATINLASLPSLFNLEAMTSGAVESVQFNVSGATYLQNDAPYRSPDDTVTWSVAPGSYSVSATAFSQDNAAGVICDTKNLTVNFVTPTNTSTNTPLPPTQTATLTPMPTSTATYTPVAPTNTPTSQPTSTPVPQATNTSTPTATPTPTSGVNGVELLTSPWHLTGKNGAAEAYQSIAPNVLQGKNTLRITYNLHGLQALGGDASAIIFDQNGWQYISLSNYGQNGLNGVQTVEIPLSAFPGLNLNATVGTLHTRFWYSKSFIVDITSIVAYTKVVGASVDTLETITNPLSLNTNMLYLPLINR